MVAIAGIDHRLPHPLWVDATTGLLWVLTAAIRLARSVALVFVMAWLVAAVQGHPGAGTVVGWLVLGIAVSFALITVLSHEITSRTPGAVRTYTASELPLAPSRAPERIRALAQTALELSVMAYLLPRFGFGLAGLLLVLASALVALTIQRMAVAVWLRRTEGDWAHRSWFWALNIAQALGIFALTRGYNDLPKPSSIVTMVVPMIIVWTVITLTMGHGSSRAVYNYQPPHGMAVTLGRDDDLGADLVEHFDPGASLADRRKLQWLTTRRVWQAVAVVTASLILMGILL